MGLARCNASHNVRALMKSTFGKHRQMAVRQSKSFPAEARRAAGARNQPADEESQWSR